MKPTDSRSVYRMRQILDLLLDEDLTRQQLAAKMHVTRQQSLCAYLDHLKWARKLHIRAWTPPAANGVRWAIYRWGYGKNAPQPPIKTHAQVMRDYRRRNQ
jgi:hypothetical protein